jgi:50S ribosomal protein L16 3-hydroxylase
MKLKIPCQLSCGTNLKRKQAEKQSRKTWNRRLDLRLISTKFLSWIFIILNFCQAFQRSFRSAKYFRIAPLEMSKDTSQVGATDATTVSTMENGSWKDTKITFDAIRAAWGEYPLLLRGAFLADVNSTFSILPMWGEIIHLACGSDIDDERMEDVPSRLIVQQQRGRMDSFELIGFGPFESAESLNQQLASSSTSQATSTLVVNDVDRWIPELSDWMDMNFGTLMPRWRRDDAQVSLANHGGGIGPHVDSYDVFLIQVAGEREWQVGVNFLVSVQEEFDHMIEACSEKGVRILNITSLMETTSASNPSIIKIHVRPGDCLYLPPRIMHWGTATSDGCMTLSVGCRAPSAKDLIGRLSEQLLLDQSSTSSRLRDLLERRFTDKLGAASTDPHGSNRLSSQVKYKLKGLILDAIKEALNDDDNFLDPLIGKIVTEPNRVSGYEVSYPMSLHDLDDECRSELGVWGNAVNCLEEVLKGNGCLRRVEGVAFAWSHIFSNEGSVKYRVYAHGRNPIEFLIAEDQNHNAINSLLDRICGGAPLDRDYFASIDIELSQNENLRSFILTLLQEGLLYGDDS